MLIQESATASSGDIQVSTSPNSIRIHASCLRPLKNYSRDALRASLTIPTRRLYVPTNSLMSKLITIRVIGVHSWFPPTQTHREASGILSVVLLLQNRILTECVSLRQNDRKMLRAFKTELYPPSRVPEARRLIARGGDDEVIENPGFDHKNHRAPEAAQADARHAFHASVAMLKRTGVAYEDQISGEKCSTWMHVLAAYNGVSDHAEGNSLTSSFGPSFFSYLDRTNALRAALPYQDGYLARIRT